MWPTARAIAQEGALGHYYSGYPAWKIAGANAAQLRCSSFRTNIVYGLLKYAPAALRPNARRLFAWQDRGFDRWVGMHLEPCDFIHAMPGQALHTFRAAKKLGIGTVLNHATGPVREWVRIMRPEYERAGLRLEKHCPYDAAYFAREDEEYALADFHCAASTVVRDQLTGIGIPGERIWVAPYGADTNARVFQRAEHASPPPFFRILFAGQLSLRKGIRTLLDALTLAKQAHWKMDFIGARSRETAKDFGRYRGATPLTFHGPLPQEQLARAMRNSSVLVLPSLEEGFGLVVPQALNCGCPCIVSDRTGGKDCIRHRENGSIVPAGDAQALAAELDWWERNPGRAVDSFTWTAGARIIIAGSQAALSR
jgi:glycosyltransferase involved in cell wall biosynthesis